MASGKPITCKYCQAEFKFDEQEERVKWKERNYECPSCKIDYSILPEMERDLRKVQDDFVASGRSKKHLDIMGKLIYKYIEGKLKSPKYINAILHKKITEDEDPIIHYTQKAAIYFFNFYLKEGRNNVIHTSFGAYLDDVIRWSLYEKKEHLSKDLSIDFELADGSTIQYKDDKFDVLEKIEDKEYKKNIVKTLMNYIQEIGKYCTPRENYIRLLMLNNYLCCGEKIVDRFFEVYNDKTGKLSYMQTLEILKQEIKNLYIDK